MTCTNCHQKIEGIEYKVSATETVCAACFQRARALPGVCNNCGEIAPEAKDNAVGYCAECLNDGSR